MANSKSLILAAVLSMLVSAFALAQPPTSIPTSNRPTVEAPFISKEGRFSIVLPSEFVPFRQNTFQSVSSWGDPMTVVQFFSYPKDTPVGRTNDPPYHALAMYFDYSASMTKLGFNSELLEIVHKSTLRKFPEFIITRTQRAYWKPVTGTRTVTERLDEAVISKGIEKPVITSYARTVDDKQLVRADSYLVGRRVYWTIAVYAPTSGFDKKSAEAFCDSFRIISD